MSEMGEVLLLGSKYFAPLLKSMNLTMNLIVDKLMLFGWGIRLSSSIIIDFVMRQVRRMADENGLISLTTLYIILTNSFVLKYYEF